jgi:uncharacterized membrane protein
MSGTNTNSQMDQSRAADRDTSPGVPRFAVEVESKLREAQGKLLEAEQRLMTSNDAPAAHAQASSPSRREPSRPAAERVDTAVAKVSAEVKEHTPVIPFTENLTENVAATLCYLFGWVSGLVFLLVDRRPFVRFHAAQSVAAFATLSILLLALSGFFLGALVPAAVGGVLFALSRIVELGWLVAAVVLMLKAASGEKYRLPWASGYADRAAREER